MESWGECSAREVLEETGLIVTGADLITVTNDFFPKEERHYATIFVKSIMVGGELELREPDKCEEWIWFDKLFIETQTNLPLFTPLKNLFEKRII